MSTPTLLLVDGDPHSRRLMEVSLRKAGHKVLAAPDAESVLSMPRDTAIDLIIADTKLPGLDGFELRRRVLDIPHWSSLPFLFLTQEGSTEDRHRGLELGVQEFLTRPIFVKEVVAKVQIMLRKKSAAVAPLPLVPREGTLDELGLVDLLQSVRQAKSSGVVYLAREEFRGRIYLRHGQVIDARVGKLDGPEAFFRLLRWADGSYTVDLRDVQQRPRIQQDLGSLLDEGLALLDECSALLARLPQQDPVMRVDLQLLARMIDSLPSQVSDVLRLFDGVRTLSRVVEDSPFPDRETLRAVVRLHEQGLIQPAGQEGEDGEQRSPSEELSRWLQDERTDHAGPALIMQSIAPPTPVHGQIFSSCSEPIDPGEVRCATAKVWPLPQQLPPVEPVPLPEPDEPAALGTWSSERLAGELTSAEQAPRATPAFIGLSRHESPGARRNAPDEESFLEIFSVSASEPAALAQETLAPGLAEPLAGAEGEAGPAPERVFATSEPPAQAGPPSALAGPEPTSAPPAGEADEPPDAAAASPAEPAGTPAGAELLPGEQEPAPIASPDAAASSLPGIPSLAWLEEEIKRRVAQELERQAEQERMQRRVEEEVQRRLSLIRERDEQQRLDTTTRAQLERAAHRQIAEETRRRQQEVLERTLQDQASELASGLAPTAEEQRRHQLRLSLLEERRKAIEEVRRRSEEILRQALDEHRQAESERQQAIEEASRAREEAELAERLRSEVAAAERMAQEEAEALLEQARVARLEADENRALALAERMRLHELTAEVPGQGSAASSLASRGEAGAATPLPRTKAPAAPAASPDDDLDERLEQAFPTPLPAAAERPAERHAARREDRIPTPAPAAPRPLAAPEQAADAAEHAFFEQRQPAADGEAHPDDELLAGMGDEEHRLPRLMLASVVLLVLLGLAVAGLLLNHFGKAAPEPLKPAGNVTPVPPRQELPAGTTAEELLAAAASSETQPAGTGQTPAGAAPAGAAPAGAAPPAGAPPAEPPTAAEAGATAPATAPAPAEPATATGAAPGPPIAPAPTPEPVRTAAAQPPAAPAAAAPRAPAPAPTPRAAAAAVPVPRPYPQAAGGARNLFNAAEKLRTQGRLEEAIRLYKQALAAKPGDVSILVGLGNALYDMRNSGEALKHFREALRIDPSNVDACLGLGMSYQDRGNKAEARQAYERFLQLAPRHRFARDVRLVLEQQLK